MTQTYRTNDGTRWGTGKGSDLAPQEVDINFWDLITRMQTQEARPDPGPVITSFSTSGALFYVHMSDGSTLGPYELPVAVFKDRGEWLPAVFYTKLDTFTINGGLYVVLFDHTSASSFDPGANDGAGHDYYSLMIQTPGSSIPTGGAVGQVIQKASTAEYSVTWGFKTAGGGAVGQVLVKNSGTQDDTVWGWLDASEIEFTPVTGSIYISNNVADALEEALHRVDANDVSFTAVSGSTIISDNVADVLEELAAGGGGGGGGALVDLTDVNVTTGSGIDGYSLTWSNSTSKWIASSVSGGGGGSSTLDGLSDVNVTPGPSIQNFALTWDDTSSKWIATAKSRLTTITALGNSGTVTLNGALGDVFTTSPTSNVLINATTTPAGAHIVVQITSANTGGFAVRFGSGFNDYNGDFIIPKNTGDVYAISFIGTGSGLTEVARSAGREGKTLATSGTVTLNPRYNDLFTCIPAGNITLNAMNAPVGQRIALVVTTAGTTSYTITFGTNFKTTGTLATGTVTAKVFVVNFVGDGTNFNEISRTTAM